MAPVILSLIQCSRPVPCAESMMLPPPCFTVGMVFLGWYSSFLLPPNTVSGIMTQKFYFGLIWPHDFLPLFSKWSLVNLRRALTCADLSRGNFCAIHHFKPLRLSVLPTVTLEMVVPAFFRSLTCSSCVVLGWFLTFLRIIETPHEVRSCMEPKSEGDWQSCLASSIF